MACEIHAVENNEDGKCPACIAGSPPDLGLNIQDDTKTSEHFG